ncbi:MAG: aminomethyl-transferring glycine dehydrogenase [Gammaproteobacteria bacterium]|nr:MAG: aminomethyl-transferring glycine dehydrogenase [Gammaproteobacteria bacterium]
MSEQYGSLDDLETNDEFIARHIGPDDAQVAEMLRVLGVDSMQALVDATVPQSIVSDAPSSLARGLDEQQTLERLRRLAERNQKLVSMIGMGYHDTVLPGVIQRNVLENPGWYTAYTPYQAEVSQGRLEALLSYQQMVMDLTGMDLANASLLDEATAAAEAMTMAKRLSKSKSKRFFVDADCHPQTIAVVQTRARPLGFEVVVGDAGTDLDGLQVFGALLQYPGSSGVVRDIGPAIACAKKAGALVCVATDLLSLCLLTPPGELGADIVLGNSQRFGVPMGFGGPHAAFFATRDAYRRSTPGRIIGVSVDSSGQPALRMALQTREQHIRREKATSNICTAQVLLAVIAGLYAAYHGPKGVKRIAERVHRLTRILAAGLERLGFEPLHDAFFDTLTVRAPGRAADIVAAARKAGFNLRPLDADTLGIACDETTSREHLTRLWKVFADKAEPPSIDDLDARLAECIPAKLRRTSGYLTHPVFNLYHAETEMLRYLRRLATKDIALDRSMIPLGSCTMKLNATTEMIPITWPEFAGIHPFAPADQVSGYRELIAELEAMLCEVTGFAAVSLQPNAGSQGEYAGLLAIRKFHEGRGEGDRNVCLIPSSAHGTNPASAHMAGMKVVVVDCDENGNVDVADLRAKAQQHADALGALMITYPSTHGVFEEAIGEICQVIHDHGGQVYMDGANLNAMLGICRPAEFGADVSHMNLHKTFCIPHGGGGPGVGPIGVVSHLAPYLPDHPVVDGVNPVAAASGTIGAIAAAPWGSACILPISWAYITMMGAAGLRRATEVAILNANYVAHRLNPHFPVLYTGKNGRVAHECIIDLRPVKESCGVTVDDVAKRLVDYGFHAPTMSFPVHDTMMVEPTESESKRELDRFCDAMIAIRQEIAALESGQGNPEDNPLRNAPHAYQSLVTEKWQHPYSREVAFFPAAQVREDKFWPPVSRIDNVYGDKHLVCGCPPMEDYSEAAD